MKNATIKALTLLLALALLLAGLPAAIAEGATAIEDTLVVGINAEPTHLAGILQGLDDDGNVTLADGETTYTFPVKAAGYVKLCDDEDLFG